MSEKSHEFTVKSTVYCECGQVLLCMSPPLYVPNALYNARVPNKPINKQFNITKGEHLLPKMYHPIQANHKSSSPDNSFCLENRNMLGEYIKRIFNLGVVIKAIKKIENFKKIPYIQYPYSCTHTA